MLKCLGWQAKKVVDLRPRHQKDHPQIYQIARFQKALMVLAKFFMLCGGGGWLWWVAGAEMWC